MEHNLLNSQDTSWGVLL